MTTVTWLTLLAKLLDGSATNAAGSGDCSCALIVIVDMLSLAPAVDDDGVVALIDMVADEDASPSALLAVVWLLLRDIAVGVDTETMCTMSPLCVDCVSSLLVEAAEVTTSADGNGCSTAALTGDDETGGSGADSLTCCCVGDAGDAGDEGDAGAGVTAATSVGGWVSACDSAAGVVGTEGGGGAGPFLMAGCCSDKISVIEEL